MARASEWVDGHGYVWCPNEPTTRLFELGKWRLLKIALNCLLGRTVVYRWDSTKEGRS